MKTVINIFCLLFVISVQAEMIDLNPKKLQNLYKMGSNWLAYLNQAFEGKTLNDIPQSIYNDELYLGDHHLPQKDESRGFFYRFDRKGECLKTNLNGRILEIVPDRQAYRCNPNLDFPTYFMFETTKGFFKKKQVLVCALFTPGGLLLDEREYMDCVNQKEGYVRILKIQKKKEGCGVWERKGRSNHKFVEVSPRHCK